MRFKSVSNPNDVYVLGNWDTSYRNVHREITSWARWHDVAGDGWTQHTPNAPISAHRINDFLYSLAKAVLGESEIHTEGDPARILAFLVEYWPRVSDRPERVQFLASLRYNADVPQYFAKQEDKVSKAEGKRHDDRWAVVPSWADGKPASVYGLLNMGGLTSDYGLRRACEFRNIMEAMKFRGICGPELAAFYGDGADEQTYNLLDLVSNLVEAERMKVEARKRLDHYEYLRSKVTG